MKRRHRMPFGAEMGGDAGTRFRLWAPSAKRVVLKVEPAQGGKLQADLNEVGGGWFEIVIAGTGAGARYSYRIDDEIDVPDPASRFNPDGVQAQSEVVDPEAFEWRDEQWRGRPWHEAVIYELHVGAFTHAGTYAAAIERLDELAGLGITALELMPLAAFPGKHGWGYDGVLPYAPHAAYGRPEDLKRLIQAAHDRNLIVLLDVVYNHFGPEGNYLPRYARDFFSGHHQTPWGDAIDFARPTVRQFFIQNALYWLEEYHFDGLRIDAVHAMHDDSSRHFIDELVDTVQNGPGRERRVHIVLENHRNEANRLRVRPLPTLPRGTGEGKKPDSLGEPDSGSSSLPLLAREGKRPDSLGEPDFSSPPPLAGGEPALRPANASAWMHWPESPHMDVDRQGREGATTVAQWNDDFHHPLHILLTGEADGYYRDYADEPIEHLGRVLAQGFAFQGERSAFSGEHRGEPSGNLPPTAFVNFLQNHDQIGNRALGERLAQLSEPARLRAALAILLLSPQIPMLFMGEEYAAAQPFLYFCDYEGDLARAISTGRRDEFAGFRAFADENERERIPDPNAAATYERSQVIYDERDPSQSQWLQYTHDLLKVRGRKVIPLIPEILPGKSTYQVSGPLLTVKWPTRQGSSLVLHANLGRTEAAASDAAKDEILFSTSESQHDSKTLGAWEVRLLLQKS